MTPYIVKGKNREEVLPGIIFLMKNTDNSSLGYSPFEIIYGRRPSFPLSQHSRNSDLNTIPTDYSEYLIRFTNRLQIIRDEVKQNTLISQEKNVDSSEYRKTPAFIY